MGAFHPGGMGKQRIVEFVWKCWALEVLCGRCGRRAQWDINALMVMFKPETTVDEIAARLKCSCGSLEGRLFTRQDVHATQTRDFARATLKDANDRAHRRR